MPMSVPFCSRPACHIRYVRIILQTENHDHEVACPGLPSRSSATCGKSPGNTWLPDVFPGDTPMGKTSRWMQQRLVVDAAGLGMLGAWRAAIETALARNGLFWPSIKEGNLLLAARPIPKHKVICCGRCRATQADCPSDFIRTR